MQLKQEEGSMDEDKTIANNYLLHCSFYRKSNAETHKLSIPAERDCQTSESACLYGEQSSPCKFDRDHLGVHFTYVSSILREKRNR